MMDSHHDFWSEPELEMTPGHLRRRMLSKHDTDRKLALTEIGRNICFGKGGGGGEPAADPNIGLAAMKNAEIGEEWLGFAREQFAAGNVRQADMDALTEKVINSQMATQDEASAWAREDRTRTKEVFQPLEDEFIKTAQEYATPEKQDAAAAEAKSDVMKASAQQGQIAERNMAGMGVNPASGRFAGVTRANDTNTALASAGAQNNARTIVRDKGLALKADAINMGKGLASSTAAAYGIGTNAGNSAVGNQGAANANFYQNNQTMAQGFQGAQQGYSNQGNILSGLYGKQVDAYGQQQQANATSSAGTGAMIGTVVGAGIMVF